MEATFQTKSNYMEMKADRRSTLSAAHANAQVVATAARNLPNVPGGRFGTLTLGGRAGGRGVVVVRQIVGCLHLLSLSVLLVPPLPVSIHQRVYGKQSLLSKLLTEQGQPTGLQVMHEGLK